MSVFIVPVVCILLFVLFERVCDVFECFACVGVLSKLNTEDDDGWPGDIEVE